MKSFIGVKYALLPALFIWALILMGCAGVGSLVSGDAVPVMEAIGVAQGFLHTLDNFYGDLVELKAVPDHTIEATRALSIADSAAVVLQAAIAGATVTDEQLNLAAGQVDGAKAILAKLN